MALSGHGSGAMSEPNIPEDWLIPITPEEEYQWMVMYGSITTLTRDGIHYRLLEPWEDGKTS
jgi:hypothetical protein